MSALASAGPSLGASAANVGIALGAVVGGQVVADVGVRETVLVGALILVACLPATLAARSLRPAGVEEDAPPAPTLIGSEAWE